MSSKQDFIPLAEPNLGGHERDYVLACLESGWISSQGDYVSQFADNFANYIGCEFALPTSNGTTALHLALAALGIGPGDEVLVPDLTFGATANAVIQCGAKPVLVDIDPLTWGMDADLAKQAITPRTRAMLVVHLYGRAANMPALLQVAKQHQLFVVEDCAESLGTRTELGMTGMVGDVGCFSFFANKVMTTGEGGMVTTNNAELMQRMQILRDHGMNKSRRYWHDEAGFNYRMTNIQAAIGLAQLQQLPGFLHERQRIAHLYAAQLHNIAELELPFAHVRDDQVVWLYCVLLADQRTRNGLLDALNEQGVQARGFFYAMHEQPAYAQLGDFPVSTELAQRGLCLPCYVGLQALQIERIGRLIRAFFQGDS